MHSDLSGCLSYLRLSIKTSSLDLAVPLTINEGGFGAFNLLVQCLMQIHN